MATDKLTVRGARANNLKNIHVEIPRDKLVVFTGLSGSGKSSLAFDTIYAEGQRRYVESLSSYARMFLGQMEKPDVDSIEGLSPAISIDQKTTSKNPRSTVGTVTEIYDYLRLLYARAGVPHCPICGKVIERQSVDQIADSVMSLTEGTKFQVMAPIVRGRKGEYRKELENAKRSGYVRARVDGSIFDLSEEIRMDKNKKHDIEIIVDRLVMREDVRARLVDALETALKLSGGLVIINEIDGEDRLFSENYACPDHGVSVPELSPRMFSFNNPLGACPTCSGLGVFLKVSPDLIVPDDTKSINDHCIKASGWGVTSWRNDDTDTIAKMYFQGIADRFGFTLDTPYRDIPEAAKQVIMYGSGDEKYEFVRNSDWGGGKYKSTFEGVVNNLERRYRETTSEFSRSEIQTVMTECDCPECHGARLKPIVLSVTIGDKNIKELCDLPVTAAVSFFKELRLGERENKIAAPIVKEVISRLEFLNTVGLGYLTLSRAAATLSGGESQRIRLATQIGSSLMGVLYILDEPSIGLHQRDNEKLLGALKNLRDQGNTLIVVEHDEDTIRSADYVVDIGPGAGIHGGEVVFSGTVEELKQCRNSVTADYLTGRRKIEVPAKRRKGNGKKLKIWGASENNLKHCNVEIPLGKFVCVTGVSGSGKSSLINGILYKTLAAELNRARLVPGKCDKITGMEHLDKVIEINQQPIGRTPRSNPATYTGVFNEIRELFAQTPDAKARGYAAGRFSFNVKGGRCESCEGDGIVKIEMHFLPDLYVPCDVCHGSRYNKETLEVRYKGKNISEVLEMTVDEALDFFGNIPRIAGKLQTLSDVGLGYIKLGQSATTLSGGEAQRVKLATELSKRATGRTIYILDEPTTGLHAADVHKLIDVLGRLTDAGNSVLVIEHNLDVIKVADHIIDLGPEGGDEGGTVVATGTPEEVAKVPASYTGLFLAKIL